MIEVIDETAISWETGSDFDRRFDAVVRVAVESGIVEVIDECAISWIVGSEFDRSFEAATGLALAVG